MANRGMTYKGEREDTTFTIPVGGTYAYTFTDTYRNPKVVIDDWSNTTKPTAVTISGKTSVDIIGAVGDTGKITVIEK